MARGPKLHLKRLFAPKDWMLSKLTGVFAPRPRAGPHKMRECLPLCIILRNVLKYAINARESSMILRQRLVQVDKRIRTDPKYPAGFMDVLTIPRSGEQFRLMYDAKGRFTLVPLTRKQTKAAPKKDDAKATGMGIDSIRANETNFKLCKVERVWTTTGRIPVITTHDGRRIRFPPPKVARGDSVLVDLTTGTVSGVIKMKAGRVATLTGGSNRGRIGEIVRVERHPGAFDIAHLKDRNGTEFATRARNVFILGSSYETIPISLPKHAGLKKPIIEERIEKLATADLLKEKIALSAIRAAK